MSVELIADLHKWHSILGMPFIADAARQIESDQKRIADLIASNKHLTEALMLRGQRLNGQRKQIIAAAEAMREAAANVCDAKEAFYDEKEGHKWAEQQTSAMEGCGECSVAIRALFVDEVLKGIKP